MPLAVVNYLRDFPPKPVQPYFPIHSSPYIIITLPQKIPLSIFFLKSWFKIITNGLLEHFYTHLTSKNRYRNIKHTFTECESKRTNPILCETFC